MPRARNLRVNLRTSHPMNTQPKIAAVFVFHSCCKFLQPDLSSRISFHVWQSILDWRYTDKLRCSLDLLSSQLSLTRSQDLISNFLTRSLLTILAVHLGIEPSVLTDSAAALLCHVLLAHISPHIFTT